MGRLGESSHSLLLRALNVLQHPHPLVLSSFDEHHEAGGDTGGDVAAAEAKVAEGHKVEAAAGPDAPPVPKTEDLWAVEHKLRQPAGPTATEDAMHREEEAAVSHEPQITGAPVELTEGSPLRDAALRASNACLHQSSVMKQAIADESISPDEMTESLGAIGHCVRDGGRLIFQLFGVNNAPFTFHGQVMDGGDFEKAWNAADEHCHALQTVVQTDSATKVHAADVLAHSGVCLKSIGAAYHATAHHHEGGEAEESSCIGLLAPPSPATLLARQRQLRSRMPASRSARVARAADFLVPLDLSGCDKR